MNIIRLPDLAAMAILLTILHFLRRRHPQEGVGMWLVGLLFIFLEALAHSFYTVLGPFHIVSHVVALDSYLAAGMIFLWASLRRIAPHRSTMIYLGANIPALAALETVYAFDVRTRRIYCLIAAFGLAMSLATPFLLEKGHRFGKVWQGTSVQILLWVSVGLFALNYMYREAAYFPLFLLYLSIAIVFGRSLPGDSMGRIAIVAGFAIWSFVFLAHPWVVIHFQYTDLTTEIWDLQKFLVTIGMLLVMLERQVSSHEWFALHDQLTGLPNRRFFEDRLDEVIQQAERTGTRVAVTMIDLNGFKAVNDSEGHEVGDRLLQHIADNLRHAVRPNDTLARLGGDEFIIVATELPANLSTPQVVERITRRILPALQKPFQASGKTFRIGGSVGVAIYPDDTTDEVLLRRLADQRMYQQKRQAESVFAN